MINKEDAKITIGYQHLIRKEFIDFNEAKDFYKIILKNFKKDNNTGYFLKILEILKETQGEDNFKKITGFNYSDISLQEMTGIDNLLKPVRNFILIVGKKKVADKTGLTVPTINRFLDPKENITINTIKSLMDNFGMNFKGEIFLN